MWLDVLVPLLVGLLPVLSFLAALLYLDSYKLVRLRLVVALVACGALAAGGTYLLHALALDVLRIDVERFARYVAPLTEELLKGLVIVWLMRTHRIGFLVDAAICGFAVGTGFAVVENLHYLRLASDAGLGTWIVRGFGTAVMHGGVTAIFAVMGLAMLEHAARPGVRALVPGYVLAVVIHSAYNHLLLSPLHSTLAILLVLPPVFYWIFERSEKLVGDWLGRGFDADAEMLELINSGRLSDSPVGRYLHAMKEKFKGPVVADLLCYLRLRTELALRAKGVLLMRESGFDVPLDEATRAKFTEMRYLESSIGKTGLLAVQPMCRMSREGPVAAAHAGGMMGLADSAQLHVLLLTSGIGTALVLASMIGRGLKIRVAKRQPHEAIDNLNTRVNAWWVIAAVIGLALLAGRVGVALLFAYASFVALREFTAGMARQRGHAPLLAASLLVAVPLQYVFVSTGHYGIYTTFIPIYAFVALPTLALALHDPRDPAPRLASLQWGLMLCVFGVSHVAALFALDVPGYEGRNAFLVAYLLVVVQASDVLQYIWGKLAGRLRIAPRWSPAKTVEGTLGGVLSATLLGALLSPITPFSLAEATLVSLAITLLGVLGGLLMSAEKRRRGLKDWGTLIKGHGGVLDRLDSLCLSAPVFYYIVRCGFGA